MKNENNYHIHFGKWLSQKRKIKVALIAIFLFAILATSTFFLFLTENELSIPGVILKILTAFSSLAFVIYFKFIKLKNVDHSAPGSKEFFFTQRNELFKSANEAGKGVAKDEQQFLDKDFSEAIDLHAQFYTEITRVFFSYFLLYGWFTIGDGLMHLSIEKKEWYKIISFTLNNLGGWFIFRCFSILFIPATRYHPKKVLSNLFNFSLFFVLGLSSVYALSLYNSSDKDFFSSGEIGILHLQNSKSDTSNKLKVYKKIISIKKEDKNPEDIIRLRALQRLNLKKDTTGNDNFQLALQIPAFLKETSLTLPQWMILETSTGQKVQNEIDLRYSDSDHDSLAIDTIVHSSDTVYKMKFFASLLTANKLKLTGFFVHFDNYSLYNSLTLNFPSYVKLYTEKSKDTINALFDIISGLINALAFALLIGRLDSRFIGMGKKWIVFLFLYPAIQPLYIVFDPSSALSYTLPPIIILVALVLKLLLAIVILYLADSGRLLTYLFCLKELDKRADSIYDNQIEIVVLRSHEHHTQYHFAINNKNKRILECDKYFNALADCLEFIKDFRKNTSEITEEKIREAYSGDSNVVTLNNQAYINYGDLTEQKLTDFLAELKDKCLYCKVKRNM